MAYGGEVLEAAVLDAIQDVDGTVSSISDSEAELIHSSWGQAAWKDACLYAISEDPTKVEEGTISGGSITTEDDEYWGMNHFKPEIKSALLNGGCLMPYFGMIPKRSAASGYDDRSRIIVITTNKIYKFDTNSFVYFNGVKAAVPHYLASEYFTYYEQSANASSAGSNGQAAYQTESSV